MTMEKSSETAIRVVKVRRGFKFVHPVLDTRGIGQCELEVDPKTGESEVCPHGYKAVLNDS